jgi:hypothetical protein
MDLTAAYKTWLKSGEPRDPNGSVDAPIKWYYLARVLHQYALETFVESGTSSGDTCARMLTEGATRVYTTEAWEQAYAAAVRRFENDDRIDVLFGDSADLLPGILDKLDGPALFWLDAHYSGDGTAKLEKQTPIVEELEAIAAAPFEHYIVIMTHEASAYGTITLQWTRWRNFVLHCSLTTTSQWRVTRSSSYRNHDQRQRLQGELLLPER